MTELNSDYGRFAKAPEFGRRRARPSESIACFGGMLIGLAFASYLYGWGILDGANVGWLLDGGDMSSHFLGWDFFRHDAWRWPPGANPTFGYVVGNSIVFSDSCPLLAIPFKLIRALLPDPFQYQGLALYANFMLNGGFAALLAYRLSGRTGSALIVAALIVTGTIVTSRGFGAHGHETLTAHWLILGAFILVWTCQTRSVESGRLSWVLLIAVSALTHFYLLVMVLAIWGAQWLTLCMTEPRSYGRLIRHALLVAVSLCTVMYLAGYFASTNTAPNATGFGYFSANLLTFFNPHSGAWFFKYPAGFGVTSLSKFLPKLPERGDGQYEGQAYMGLGLLIMVGVGMCSWLLGKSFKFSRGACALIATAVLLALLAFSNVVSVGDKEILNLDIGPLLATLFGVVRASGRFIWVLYYLLIFGAFLAIARYFSPKATFACMSLVLMLQMADLAPWHRYLHNVSRHLSGAPAIANDADLNRLVSGAARMVFLPVKSIPEGFGGFSFIAARHGVAVNATYSARTSETLLARANQLETDKLLSGGGMPDEVYVVDASAGTVWGLSGPVCRQKTMECLPSEWGQIIVMRKRAQ